MLQELLMGMSGISGELILETSNSFVANPNATIFSQSERTIINEIVHLGFLYKHLNSWIEHSTNDFMEQLIIDKPMTEGVLEIETQEELKEEEKPIITKFGRTLNKITRQFLDEYYELILAVEQKYLYGTIINLNEFKVIFSEFFEIFPEIYQMITQKQSSGIINSCMVLDFLYERKLTGNIHLKKLYTRFFDASWKTFTEILCFWVLRGKIESAWPESFFIKKTTIKSLKRQTGERQMDWDNDYTLNYNLIPINVVTFKTAKNILFIGKMVRILKKEPIFLNHVLTILFGFSEKFINFEPFEFSQTLNQMVLVVSQLFLDLIVKSKRILEDLSIVRDYFLLCQDEFYHIFIDECLEKFALPPTQNSEFEINRKALQNTLLRINKSKFERDFKKVKFIIKSKGFNYQNFSDRTNLLLSGDVEHNNSFLRFKPYKNQMISGPKPAIWSVIKHYFEKNFQSSFSFKFRKVGPRYVNEESALNPKINATTLTFLIQALETVKPNSFNQNLNDLTSIREYFAVHIGLFLDESNLTGQDRKLTSYLSITSKKPGSNQSRILLETILPINFINIADQDNHFVKILYHNNILSIFISTDKITNDLKIKPSLELPINLSDFLSLDIGRGSVGLMNSENSGNYNIDIYDWMLFCQSSHQQSSGWAGLVPFYQCKWPINIILNDSFFERCATLFSLIFPLKVSKIKLNNIHLSISSFDPKKVEGKFILFMSHLKVILDNMISGLLEYIYDDIIQKEWKRLETGLLEAADFEQLLQTIDFFLEQTMTGLFFDYNQLLQDIFRIIEFVDSLESIVINDNRQSFELIAKKYSYLRECIESTMKSVLSNLNRVSQTNKCYGRLMLRIGFNNYYEKESEELDN